MAKAFETKDKYNAEDLVKIMSLLRGEGGCPWDMAQTHKSVRNNFIEETYEAVEAIDNDDSVLLQEELGDVLLQIVFHAQMAKEENKFDFDEVCNGICQKLIYRHPHIFGDVIAGDVDQVLATWDVMKQKEKEQTTASETLQAVSRALPSLMRTNKVQHRAVKSGIYPQDLASTLEDLATSLQSLAKEVREEAESRKGESYAEHIGEMLFCTVNLSRILGKDPEEALYRYCDLFIERFNKVEEFAVSQGEDVGQYSLEDKLELWEKARKKDI